MTTLLRPNILRLKSRGTRRWRVVLGILAIALPATADAPTNPPQYAKFAFDSPEITDRFTGLQWDRRRVEQLSRSSAELYCNSTVFPGSGRLPTVKELLTLVDESPHEDFDGKRKPPTFLVSIDQGAFPGAPTDKAYWTSTPATGGDFWTVEFTAGRTKAAPPAAVLNVRCVR